jgi:hypothetical protein
VAPDGLTFYDVPATDPEGRGYAAAFGVGGGDEGYTSCAVAVRLPRADIYAAACNFVVGGEDTCGFSPAPGLTPQGRHTA